ncbi:COP9 signalosome complex subunit 3-like [Tubulanus polymorphus]|uniref:COP9 signalosome complex subunit 3-like n=1 Tax=Tubulanus polymorphus TaxID=672921 RepID=UPI003DA381D5
MAALEQYVNNVRSLSTQGNFAQLCEFISKSTEVLGKNLPHLDNLLGTLDVQQHSLGVLGILLVKLSNPISDFETLFVQIQEFINSCNGEQCRYAVDSYSELCHKFTQSLIDKKEAIRGINIVQKAINKIQLFPSQLTSIHGDLCQLCLLSKCFKPALQILDIDITDICKEGGQYDARHLLLYYYYGGMIYTGLKNYERALYFYEIAITTPSMAVSHIMLEAYKKYILVALILHGKIPCLPKYTSQVVGRYIKPLCQGYQDISVAYASNNPTDLQAQVNKHQDTIIRDSNMGLVKQCISSLYKKNIQRLTKTFMTLSLADMANRVKLTDPVEAEKYVLHMIEDGEIYASINQKDGMVSFHDNPEKYNNISMLIKLDAEMQQCIQLDEKLQEMDREVAVDPQFVKKNSGVHEDDMPGSSIKLSTYAM